MTGWIPYPQVTAALAHGAGKSAITGTLHIAFTGTGTAYVTTAGAHHNDDNPAVTYRGAQWLVGVHLQRGADGVWAETHHSRRGGITRRGRLADAPHTYRAAIRDAVIAATAGLWTPELDRAAAYAHAAQRLHAQEGQRAEAARILADIDTDIAALRAVMAANAPEGES